MTTYVQDPVTLELIPKEQYQREPLSAYVIPDIGGYKSMQTGEWISSRSQHRAHLKKHGLIEIGNEVKTAMTQQKPKKDPTIKRDIINAVNSVMG